MARKQALRQKALEDSEGPIDQIPPELAKARDEYHQTVVELKVAVNTAKKQVGDAESKLRFLMKSNKVPKLRVIAPDGPKDITIEVVEKIKMKRVLKPSKKMQM